MPRKRTFSRRRKTVVFGPARKRSKINTVTETKHNETDLCLSDAETLPNVGSPGSKCVAVDLEGDDDKIPVITVYDSDSSLTVEPKESFTEHETNKCEKCGAPSKYSRSLGTRCSVSCHTGGSPCENKKSSRESEVSGLFEMLWSKERLKKEPLDNACNSENVSTFSEHSFSLITTVPTKSHIESEILCTKRFKAEDDECCYISTLHTSNVNNKSNAVGLLISDKSDENAISSSEIHNASAPIKSVTPHVKVERTESTGDMKCLGTVADVDHSGNATATLFSGNQDETCNLLEKQGKNNSNIEEFLKCTKVKQELSEDKENVSTGSGTTSNKAESKNAIKYGQLHNITYELKNIPEPYLHTVTDSQSQNLFDKASWETSSNTSTNIAFENQKSVVSNTGVLCNEDSSSAGCSSFDLSTLSLNPTEQKAAEVVGSLPEEKLMILIKEYAGRLDLNLEPVLQKTSKDPSKPFNQIDSATHLSKNHAGVMLPHTNADTRGSFCQNKKFVSLDAATTGILHDSGQQRVKDFFCSGLIKTDTYKSFLDVTRKLGNTQVREQNSGVSSPCGCKGNKNKSDEHCSPSVSTEDKDEILHLSLDEKKPYFAIEGSGHATEEGSVELVLENRNLLMKNAPSSLEPYAGNCHDKGNELGGSGTLCGASHAAEANPPSSAGKSSVQLVSDCQQNLIKNVSEKEKYSNAGIEVTNDCTVEKTASTVKTSLSCSPCCGNSPNLVTQSQQILHKGFSSTENSKEKHQSPDNFILKHNSETTKISNEKNHVLSNQLVPTNQLSDFHCDVSELCSEIQVKKELEDTSLFNDMKSAFHTEDRLNLCSVNINKLFTVGMLRSIIDAVSCSSDNSFDRESVVDEASYSKQGPFSSAKLDETAFTSSVKKESEYSKNLLLTGRGILQAIAQTCDSSVLTSTRVSSLGNEHYSEGSFEKCEFVSKQVEFCKKEQEVLGSSALAVGVSTLNCEEICNEQSSADKTVVSKLDEQNQSNVESNVQIMQSTTENCNIMEGNKTTYGIQNTNFSRNRRLQSDCAESFASGNEENADTSGVQFSTYMERNLENDNGSYQNFNVKKDSLCDVGNFSCRSVEDDTKTGKRCKHVSPKVNEKNKVALSEDIQHTVQENNVLFTDDRCNTHAQTSSEESENLIVKGFSSLSCKEKESSDSVVSKKSGSENVKSKPETSVGRSPCALVNENVENFCDEKACVSSEHVQPETTGKNQPLQESSACATNNSGDAIALSTRGSNKVQRFASRASFLTNEMLDFESKITQKQHKALKAKKNEQAIDLLNSYESHLLVKTPDININAYGKNFGVSEEHNGTSAFDVESKNRTETAVNEDLIMHSPSNNVEVPRQIETLISREPSEPAVFNRDPRRRIEVLVNSEHSKWNPSNKEDSSSLNNEADISLNTNAKLSEEYRKFCEFTESQKYVRFPQTAESYSQHCQNVYAANNGYWNYSNYVHRNSYPGVDYFRTPRYPNFSPYQTGVSPWFTGYSNTSLPYQLLPQFLPPHSQFGHPLQGYQGIPNRPPFSRALHASPFTAGYPSRHSFPSINSLRLPSFYPSQAYRSPVQPDSEPSQNPVFSPPVSPEHLVPSTASPSKTSATTPSSESLHTDRAYPTGSEPVQSEYVSSAASGSSRGTSRSKTVKVPHKVHSSEEPASPSRSSSLQCEDLVSENPVLVPEVAIPDIKHSKKSSSGVSHSCAPKNLKSSVLTYDKSKKKLSSKDFFNCVLAWSVNWLSQQLHISSAPPVTEKTKKAEAVYECYSDYYNTYFPFLLLETWELIFQAWKKEKCFHNYSCHLKQCNDYDKRLYEVHFEVAVSSTDFSNGKYPTEGHLVIIKYPLKGGGSTKMYGYICSHSFRPFNRSVDFDNPLYKGTNRKPNESDLFLSLVLRTSWKCENIDPEILPHLHSLHFLKPVVKQFDALVKLQYSPLCKALLSPEETNCKFISLSKGQSIKLNELDMDIVTEISIAILQPNHKVVVIEAAPGTNKVNTFVKVFELIKSCEATVGKVRLLFCSQSSELLDNLGCSLSRSEPGEETKNKPRCVRVGKLTDIHPEMRNLSLHTLVETYIEELRHNELEKCEKEINEQLIKVTDTRDKVATLKKVSAALAAKLEQTVPELQNELKEKIRQKEIVKVNHENLYEQHKNDGQCSILLGSEITLTVLSDYHQLEVFHTPGRKAFIPFNCCIIDDANLCSEVETLPPLLSEIETLVLCGDPDVAPAVLSKVVEKNNPYLSCFRRIGSQIQTNDKKI